METELTDVTYTNLPGYRLRYGSSGLMTLLRIALQIPKILISIKRENKQLTRLLQQFNASILISDNRYGIFSSTIPSFLITHQLHINTGLGQLVNRIVSRRIHKMIARFRECWVPDFSDGTVLSGELSHLHNTPLFPVRYIGPLSRFAVCTSVSSKHLLVVLSGPEPQRSLLESVLLKQLISLPGPVVVVRGVPPGTPAPIKARSFPDHIRVFDYADSPTLNKLLCEASVVISRAGYTSIMDIFKLGKKAVLVPTPGQAEQQYLGRFLAKRQMAVLAQQRNINLKDAVAKAERIQPVDELNMEFYREAIAAGIAAALPGTRLT